MDDQHLFPKSGATFFEWLNATGFSFRHVPSAQTCPVEANHRDRPAPATFHPDTKTPGVYGSNVAKLHLHVINYVLYYSYGGETMKSYSSREVMKMLIQAGWSGLIFQ